MGSTETNVSRRSLLIPALSLLVVGTALIPAPAVQASVLGGWHIECGHLNGTEKVRAQDGTAWPGIGAHANSDDVIKFPRMPGASHAHIYGGNPVTDAFTVATGPNPSTRHAGDELLIGSDTTPPYAGASECGWDAATGLTDPENFSSYWAPQLYDRTTGSPVALRYTLAYYKSDTNCSPGSVDCVAAVYKPFPAGFQMVAGLPMIRDSASTECRVGAGEDLWTCDLSDPRSVAAWTCRNDDDPTDGQTAPPFVRTLDAVPSLGWPALDCTNYPSYDPTGAPLPSHYGLNVTFPTCIAANPGRDGTRLPKWAMTYFSGATDRSPRGAPANVSFGNLMASFYDGGAGRGITRGLCPGMTLDTLRAGPMTNGCYAVTMWNSMSAPPEDATGGSPTGQWCLVVGLRLTFVFQATSPSDGFYLGSDCRSTGPDCVSGTATTEWDGMSGHADYFSAWNPEIKAGTVPTLQHGVDVCINRGRNCGLIFGDGSGSQLIDK